MALRSLSHGLLTSDSNFFAIMTLKHQKTYLVHLLFCQKIEFSSTAIVPTHRSILYWFNKIKRKSPKNAALKKDVLYLNISIFLPPRVECPFLNGLG